MLHPRRLLFHTLAYEESELTAFNLGVHRRDFLYVTTGAIASVGGAMAMWPFIDQMEPGANVLSAGAPVAIDLAPLELGQQIVLVWRAKPIFVVRRTQVNLAGLKNPTLLAQLRDPDSAEPQQPAYAANWCRAANPEFLVLVGICTHLGCIPTFAPKPGSLNPDWPGGYLCHCHGSRYDLAGRVFKGVPAPYNLPVPPYHFAGKTSLVVGENPPGGTFDLSRVLEV